MIHIREEEERLIEENVTKTDCVSWDLKDDQDLELTEMGTSARKKTF